MSFSHIIREKQTQVNHLVMMSISQYFILGLILLALGWIVYSTIFKKGK